MSRPTVVATFASSQQASVAAMFLRSHGLLVSISGDEAGGALSGLALSGGFKLLVPEEQEMSALALLENPTGADDFLSPRDSDDDTTADESAER